MNIHDRGYKRLFSNRTIFRQLLEAFVGQEWLDTLDFDTCETVDKSFVSDHYKETESDLIYKIQCHDREVYIYILIEFQSTVDEFMALRVLNYITNFYMDFVANIRDVKKLPAVFPIVLYNGKAPWTAPVKLSELIEETPPLGKFAIGFEHFLIAENEFTKEALSKIRNIVSTLFSAESDYDSETLAEELFKLFSSQPDKQAVVQLVNWFRQLAETGRIDPKDYHLFEREYRSAEEVRMVFLTEIEEARQRFFQNGLLEGKQEGLLEGKIETAKEMLAEGMEAEFISRMTKLPESQILQLRDELASTKK